MSNLLKLAPICQRIRNKEPERIVIIVIIPALCHFLCLSGKRSAEMSNYFDKYSFVLSVWN